MFRQALTLILFTLAAPALADSFTVSCTSNAPGPWADSMFCNEAKLLTFTPPSTRSEMVLRITAPRTHCSEISYILHRFGSSDPVAIVERVKPGERKTVSLGSGWPVTVNSVTLTAVGHIGGCNTGTLVSWGAETRFIPL